MRRLPDRAGASAPTPRKRRKLVYSLLAILVFVGLAPLASFAFKLIDTSRRALVTSQQEMELQLASSIAGQIDTFVDGLSRQMSTLAQSFGAGIEEGGLRAFQDDLQKRSVLDGLLDDQLVALRFAPLEGRIDQALMGTGSPPAELQTLLAKEYAGIVGAPGSVEAPSILVSDPVLIGPRGFAGVVVSVPVFTRGE